MHQVPDTPNQDNPIDFGDGASDLNPDDIEQLRSSKVLLPQPSTVHVQVTAQSSLLPSQVLRPKVSA